MVMRGNVEQQLELDVDQSIKPYYLSGEPVLADTGADAMFETGYGISFLVSFRFSHLSQARF